MKLPQRWTAQPGNLTLTQGYRHFQLLGEQGKGCLLYTSDAADE